jgi:hypothetical protein
MRWPSAPFAIVRFIVIVLALIAYIPDHKTPQFGE